MKAYWVANYSEIKDNERLKKYAVKAKEAVEKYSGKILACQILMLCPTTQPY